MVIQDISVTRFLSAVRFSLALTLFGFVFSSDDQKCFADDVVNPEPNAPGQVVAYDGFDQEYSLDWKRIREDKSSVSLEKRPGTLTIATQAGSLSRNSPVPPRNLFLMDNPVADGGDFAITVCVDSFKPTQKYQQAGLLVYNDDDHYLKNDMEFSGSRPMFKFIREWEQVQTIATDMPVPKSEKTWIRVVKRGNVYERLYSSDGKTFISKGELSWGDGAPLKLGLIAINGPMRADSIDASFDFFEVRELSDAEKNDPRVLARNELQGEWTVTASELGGNQITDSPFSVFKFKGGRLTLTENRGIVETEYVLDPNKSPSRFTMLNSNWTKTKRANGIYEQNGDELRICLAMSEGEPAPKEFASRRPTDLLLTLKRVDDEAGK